MIDLTETGPISRRFFFCALLATLCAPALNTRAEEVELSTVTIDISSETAASGIGQTTEPLPNEEPEITLPKWLAQAEKHYSAGLKAEEDGKTVLAEKEMRKALRFLTKAPADISFLEMKGEIEAFFSHVEDSLEAGAKQAEPGLNVTQQELESAPNVDTPAEVEFKKYTIPIDPEDPLVKKYIAIYTGPRREEMARALERMGLYRAMIAKELKAARMPRELLYLPIVESEYVNTNVSRAGANGLWQFMSDTARGYGLKVNYWIDERRDPEKATKAAIKYLKNLHELFDDWHLALAGYNRGEYGVQRDMESTRSPGFGLLAERRALPSETQQYVPKFMACVVIADNAASYGFQPVQAQPLATDEAILNKPLDLKIAAKCAGVTEETIRDLNPALRVWCTPKNDTSFSLKIPSGTKEKFTTELAQVKDWTPYSPPEVIKYKVKRGDVLGSIAQRHKTTVATLQKDNKIKDPRRLQPGQTLLIRTKPSRN